MIGAILKQAAKVLGRGAKAGAGAVATAEVANAPTRPQGGGADQQPPAGGGLGSDNQALSPRSPSSLSLP